MTRTDGALLPTSPPAGWTAGTRELRFTFGELRVFTARFRAWTAEPHSLEGSDGLASVPAFASVPRDVRVLAIQSLPVDADLPKVTRLPGALRYVPAHFNHYVIELAGSFTDYLARLSGKSRHEMARKVRRFEAFSGGRHELREYRTVADVPEFMRLATGLSRATYQSRLLAVGLPEGAEFVQELEAAAGRDDFRGYVLLVDGRAVAYGFCRAMRDAIFFEHTGYDPALATHSPGIFLLQQMLMRVFAENRFTLFDFGTGDAQYKRSYSTKSRRCATVLLFRRSIRSTLVVGIHRALTGASDACVHLLKTLGIKDRVKRLLRRSKRGSAGSAAPEDQDRTPEFGT
jgi:CelD/BcsL family acetyltransferase involved in cellulose biosynthesis